MHRRYLPSSTLLNPISISNKDGTSNSELELPLKYRAGVKCTSRNIDKIRNHPDKFSTNTLTPPSYLKGSFTLLVFGGRSGGSSAAESSITAAAVVVVGSGGC